MLSALLRPFKGSSSRDGEPADVEQDFGSRPSVAEYRNHPHATADFTEADDDDDEEESIGGEPSGQQTNGLPNGDVNDPPRSNEFLPLFTANANHLDSIPIYNITHAIRIVVQTRTETTLSWDQLRSPQVTQFLIKPMLQQIRSQHFCRGTLYALLANCLQFEKEGQLYPGTAGTSATRAKVCELLAIKLLKEYTTRELIDALCYDFYPLQGIPGTQTPLASGGLAKPSALRTSTLEVAIRASAQQFLSHPLVVQKIEAIWNGAISFSSPKEQQPQRHGSTASAAGSSSNSQQPRRQSNARTPLLGDQRAKEEPPRLSSFTTGRRAVTLYNPRTASPFKLSRLRVPRYRRLFSTCSLFVLIGLFLTVLGQRSSTITSLELLFWFWSAGFMLDELVGFNEDGFSFYVMSFWNIFDLGILLLLIVYYCMRIYGVFLLDPHKLNQNAYDVLAVNAILLLPRIFGVLDHYRHFSRLLISFRLLAVDLVSVCVPILVCCSGFFVFLAFSRGPDDSLAVAFKMFQALIGFTAPAWDLWPSYNWMGQILLGVFLIISHFIIITLLVTVLANSFMSISSRANEEYQFNFAINTISMARNNVLFSYVAPGNIFAWALMPLRYCMSLEQYVWMNRTVIKATHFPLLFCIFFYERFFLAPDVFEPTDLVDNPRRDRTNTFSGSAFFSPSVRVREESVAGFQKDQALEEVFRRAPDMRSQRRTERRKTQTEIRSWMDQQEAGFNSPRNFSTIDSRMSSDWMRRLSMNRDRPSRIPRHYSDIRSTASDPADFIFDAPYPVMPTSMYNDGVVRRDHAHAHAASVKEQVDAAADGDDELVTNDEDEGDDATNTIDGRGFSGANVIEEDYFTTPVGTRFSSGGDLGIDSPRPPTSRRIPLHTRTLSTNTILYAPEEAQPYSSSSASAHPFPRPPSTRHGGLVATPLTPGNGNGNGRRSSPRRSFYLGSRPRSMIQPSNRAGSSGLTLDIPTTSPLYKPPRRRSLADLLLTPSAYDNSGVGRAGPGSGMGPGTGTFSPAGRSSSDAAAARGSGAEVNKLMLARMKSLEESLGSMVKEMRTLRRRSVPNTAANSDDGVLGDRFWGGRQHHRQNHPHSAYPYSQSHSQHHQHHQSQHHHQHHRSERGEHRQQQSYHSRSVVGSDPSSISGVGSGGGPLMEGGVAMATSTTRRATVPSRKEKTGAAAAAAAATGGGGGSGSGGVWKSPKAEGLPAGLGINKGGVIVRNDSKGKEKERGNHGAGNGYGTTSGAGVSVSLDTAMATTTTTTTTGTGTGATGATGKSGKGGEGPTKGVSL